MKNLIQPHVLKGFRDFLPDTEIVRRKVVNALENYFQSCGYVPIDTPALEYADILLSKGGGETDKQIYRFTDHGGRDVAMRFDLTVPFARFAARHRNVLPMPFKRCHIGKVWRGENTQRGRYREFIQCDFDIVGVDSPSADLEIMLMMAECMNTIGVGKTVIRFSNRELFNALLAELGVANFSGEILRIVDKRAKIGDEEVNKLLLELIHADAAAVLTDFIAPKSDNRETLSNMAALAAAEATAPHRRILDILDAAEELGMEGVFHLDPSITRGLDYYTGIVFETFLNELPELGSVCSGGRYDNLTGLFMTEPLSGVGASIGLDRLMAGMEELGRLKKRLSSTDVLIIMLDGALIGYYHNLACELRKQGLATEVYPETKKIAAQFKYAETRDIPLALIAGPDEKAAGTVNLKNLRSRKSYNGLSLAKALELMSEFLS